MFRTSHTITRRAAGLALVACLAGISASSVFASGPIPSQYAIWLAGPQRHLMDGRSPDTRDAAERAHEPVVSRRLVRLASVGLAQDVLEARFGFSSARAESWTTGACSYEDRPPSCYLSPAQARATAQAEARSLGANRVSHLMPHA